MICLLLAAVLCSPAVSDSTGAPVPGATVTGPDGSFIGITGPDGSLPSPVAPGDSLTIRALGYRTWIGRAPSDRGITLLAEPLAWVTVIPVRAPRYSLRERIPSTSVIAGGGLRSVGRFGIPSASSSAGGIHVREYGGAMPVLSVSLRGSDPAQVGWMLGSHSVQSPTDGLPGLLLDPELFGSMEISRGGASAFPGGGMAGTVSLEPQSTDESARLILRADSRGGAKILAGVSPHGLLRLAASSAATTGAGGSRGRTSSLLASGSSRVLGFGALFTSGTAELEDPDWSVDTHSARSVSSADAWTSVSGSRLRFTTGIHLGRSVYTAAYPEEIRDSRGDGQAESRLSLSTGALGAGLLLQADGACDWTGGGSPGDHSRWRSGLSTCVTAAAGPVSGALSARTEASPGLSPEYGIRAQASVPLSDSALAVSLSASSGFRRPTFNELYWPADNFAEGNPDLDPEHSTEFSVDMAVHLTEPLDLRLSAWTGRIEDLIAWQPGPSGKWRPVNNAMVLKQGMEASAELRTGPLSASGRVTVMRCVDDDPSSTCHGCELPYRPSLLWGGSIGAGGGRVSAELSVRGAGRRFTNAANTQALPPYWLADALLGYRPAFLEGWTVSLGGTNILDERYEETTGFPGRPGAVLFELSWEGRI